MWKKCVFVANGRRRSTVGWSVGSGSGPIVRWYPLTAAQRTQNISNRSGPPTVSEIPKPLQVILCYQSPILPQTDRHGLEKVRYTYKAGCCSSEGRAHRPAVRFSISHGRKPVDQLFPKRFVSKFILLFLLISSLLLRHRKRFYFIYILIACSPLDTKLSRGKHKNSFHLTFFFCILSSLRH